MAVTVREKKKGSGEYWIFINHNGIRRSKKIGRDKKIAREVADKVKAKLVLGDLKIDDDKHVPLFSECAKKWLSYIAVNRRESTHERYSQVLRDHVLPTLKDFPIDKINRGTVKALLLDKLKAGLSVGIIRDVISGVMQDAQDNELIDNNPVQGVVKKLDVKKNKSVKNSTEPLNETELNEFLNSVQEHMPQYYPFFLTAARTGMRLGELLGLHWGDIQLNNPVILDGGIVENRPYAEVKRSHRRGITGPTKTGKTRHVDLSGQLVAVLTEYHAKAKREAFLAGAEVPELVFHKKGKPIEQNQARRLFERGLEKAGIRKIKFHALRHTFASLLLSKGESPVYVKEQLGHSSIQITVDIYGKWLPTARAIGVNRLDSLHPTAPYAHPEKIKKA